MSILSSLVQGAIPPRHQPPPDRPDRPAEAPVQPRPQAPDRSDRLLEALIQPQRQAPVHPAEAPISPQRQAPDRPDRPAEAPDRPSVEAFGSQNRIPDDEVRRLRGLAEGKFTLAEFEWLIDASATVTVTPQRAIQWVEWAIRQAEDRQIKAEILAGMRPQPVVNIRNGVSRWRIVMRDGSEIDTVFAPPLRNLDEIKTAYPEALTAEPLPLPPDLPDPESADPADR